MITKGERICMWMSGLEGFARPFFWGKKKMLEVTVL